jgi:hypothetical protein
MGGFSLIVELHREGSAPAACAAGLFLQQVKITIRQLLMSLLKVKTLMTVGRVSYKRDYPRLVCIAMQE